jgi:hypothetical protein
MRAPWARVLRDRYSENAEMQKCRNEVPSYLINYDNQRTKLKNQIFKNENACP